MRCVAPAGSARAYSYSSRSPFYSRLTLALAVGQSKPVLTLRLETAGSVEERVRSSSERKRAVRIIRS